MADSKILIIGASGRNGRALITLLAARGIRTRAMARNQTAAMQLLGDTNVELMWGDLNNIDSIANALNGIEKIYIVTAIDQNMVTWFKNFLTAANSSSLKYVVKISGGGANINSKSEVLRQHAETDGLLRGSGLDFTILRANSFFQNMLWQARQIQTRKKFSLPLGDARQSLVDIRDVAEVAANLLLEENQKNIEFKLTGNESLSFYDIANQLSNVIGEEIKYLPISSQVAEQRMLTTGMSHWHAHSMAEIQEVYSTGAYADVTNDLELLIGRKPRLFSEFANEFVGQFKKDRRA